jgi:hypothetical protein
MGRFVSNKSVNDLINDLADDRKRESALVTLSQMGPAVIPDLIGVLTDEQRRGYAGVLLAKIGEPAIPALVNVLDENKGGSYARVALARIQRPDLIIPLLISALGDKARQAHACGMLDDYGMPTLGPYLPLLIDALGDKDKQVYASTALVNVGPAATPHLLTAIPDDRKRFWAAFTLNKIDPSVYTEQWLKKMASEPSAQVKETAISRSGRYCPHCGNVMGVDHAYCASCGKKVERTTPLTPSTTSPTQKTEPPMRIAKVTQDPAAGHPHYRADTGSEYVVGGFTSSDMARPGSLGYAIYITNRRIIGVKKPGLFAKAAGATVAGTVMGAVLGIGTKWTVRNTLGRDLTPEENMALLAELEKSKDIELMNQDVTLIQLKRKFFTNPGQIAFFLKGAQQTEITISLANDEVVDDLRALFAEHFPRVLKVVN